jgi:hypothetical protein
MARVAGAIVTVAAIVALTAASRISIGGSAPDAAMLRLAWTARPERVEQCRTISDEDMALRPAHMRQQVVCEGVTARYVVRVLYNGRPLVTDTVQGGGLRRDRHLYHFRQLAVPVGTAAVEVRVDRIGIGNDAGGPVGTPAGDPAGGPAGDGGPDAATGLAARDLEQRSRRRADEVPPSLIFQETVTLAPREVVVVTYDRGARQLRAIRREQR